MDFDSHDVAMILEDLSMGGLVWRNHNFQMAEVHQGRWKFKKCAVDSEHTWRAWSELI